MKKSSSSRRWLKEHFTDPYVKQAQQQGFRSRAAFKLIEIQEKDHIFSQGMCVVDLGAAPGGWLQVAEKYLGTQGRLLGIDLLEIPPLPNAICVQADFTDPGIIQQIQALLNHRAPDLILSDMSPNLTGIKAVDQPRAMYLVELAFDFALTHLKNGGHFVCKVFQGEGFDVLMKAARLQFEQVKIRKPRASRDRSPELYLVAKNKQERKNK